MTLYYDYEMKRISSDLFKLYLQWNCQHADDSPPPGLSMRVRETCTVHLLRGDQAAVVVLCADTTQSR